MSSSSPPDLILFCPSSFGGIPDYAHHQAEALGRAGGSVLMLCPPDYPHRAEHYRQDKCLPGGGARPANKLVRVGKLVSEMMGGYRVLAKRVRESGAKRVLMASYGEYLAPLWAWRMRALRKEGVIFGAVVHDPVRDFVVGPKLWHQWSISEGYSYLDHAFVHEPIQLDTGARKVELRTHVIPHGPYPFPDPVRTRSEVREELGIPESVPLFLSFGHVRDGKNLGLVLEAMAKVRDAWLLVVGTEAGTGHTKSADYRKKAEDLGIADRCRWIIGFASPEEAANCFIAADFALLTYERRFRSASGVLNVAARYRRPVLASCGESNLASAVKNYRLGPWVEPDRADEIARGMKDILTSSPEPEWSRYAEENSWERNAELVMLKMEVA